MPAFGDMLKYLRKRANLTQQELADKVGLSRSRINNYEQGVREPDFETAEALADFFNVDLDTLLARASLFSSKPYSDGEVDITSMLSKLSDDQLNDLFFQLISGRDKDSLVTLASKILALASEK